MAITLTQKAKQRHEDYDPVTTEDGVVLSFSLRQDGDIVIVRCSAKKDSKEIAYGSWNTESDRFSVHIDPMKSCTNPKALAQDIMDGIFQIVESL